MLAQQESSLLLPMVSFSGLLYPGSVLPALPPFPSPLSATSPPCPLRQDSSWGGGVGIRVASFPPGSHWPAGLLTRLWLAAPISIFPSDRLGSLSAVGGLDTSIYINICMYFIYFIYNKVPIRIRGKKVGIRIPHSAVNKFQQLHYLLIPI